MADAPAEPRDPVRWALAKKIAFWSLVARPKACTGYRVQMLDELREAAYEALTLEADLIEDGTIPPEHISASARALCRQLIEVQTDPAAKFDYLDSDFLPP